MLIIIQSSSLGKSYKVYVRSATRKSCDTPSFSYTIILQAIATSNRIKTSTGLYITVIVAHDVNSSYVKLVSSYSYGKCALCGGTSTNSYKALKLYLMK